MHIRAASLIFVLCCAAGAGAEDGTRYSVRSIALPGGTGQGIAMDYLAFDPTTKMLWVPAGNTGAVDVIDTNSGQIRQIGNLPTAEVTNGDRKRTVGPSSATVGQNVVYVGNRADATICSYNAASLSRNACGHVPSMPDGVSYVANTKEVWVTTPRDNTIRILDAAHLDEKSHIVLEGAPEGYAVDRKRGLFYTNLEDQDKTVAIDVRTRKIVSTWKSSCGEAGPRGIVVDAQANLVFVACTDRVETRDPRHQGRVVASVATGAGVDSIDYSAAKHQIYAGAARSGDLTIIDVGRAGHLAIANHVATSQGARNGVLAANGSIYLTHSAGNELMVVSPQRQ
jgi:DNA-binding beta-propeller fold protein YncE